MGKNKYGSLIKSEMSECLNKNAGDGRTELFEDGDNLVIRFIDSNRYYEVSSDGDVSSPITKEQIPYAGDITKNGNCDGTENNPFQINCIEDLVAFSQNVTNGNNYEGRYIILMRNLDFNSIFSYNDPATKEYDTFLGGNGTTELKTQLSNNGKGFFPIGFFGYTPGSKNTFKGTFDGNNYNLKNIYINIEYEASQTYSSCGLFSYNYGTIKNLTLAKGKIYSSNFNYTGGLVGSNFGTIINCTNQADVYSDSNVGGISGRGAGVFEQCGNEGNIVASRSNVRWNFRN